MPIAKRDPKRARDENRRVAAAEESDKQSEREILRRIAAEPIQRKRREQHSADRIQGSCQGLVNASIRQLDDITAAPEMETQILADTVENDDGIVDGITDNR